MAFVTAAALFFSSRRPHWAYWGAGLGCLWVAFDERNMFHECLRLSFPAAKHAVGGDFTVLFLALTGIVGCSFGFFKLARSRLEKCLYLTAGAVCALDIYLDVYAGKLFYLLLDTEIEEIAEIVLAVNLIAIGFLTGLRRRVFIILPLFILLLLSSHVVIRGYVWEMCPRLKLFE